MSEIRIQNGRRWAVLIPALVFPLIASFFYWVLFPGTVVGKSLYGTIKFWLLIWPIVATALILREPFRRKTPAPGDRRKSIWWGTAFGVATVALMGVLFEFSPLGDIIRSAEGDIRDMVEKLGVLEHFLLFALFISILHSALEEFYWRWFVFGNLRHLVSTRWAIVIAAMGFASHHVVILNGFFPFGHALFFGICVGIGGAVWSWVYQRYETLWGAWVSHMIIDFGALGIGYFLLFGS